MKKILLGSFSVVALLLSSCSSYQYTARQTNVVRQNITMSPTIVDVKPDYAKRVEVTSSWCKTKEEALNECKFNAITTHNIDVVVDPIFKVEYNKSQLSRPYKATLVGFAGYYVNSRTLYEDMERLKAFSREDIEKYLILHQPEVLKYMNAQGDVVNIYHNENSTDKTVEPTPVVQEEPTTPQNVTKTNTSKRKK
jgi:hypothetical protein